MDGVDHDDPHALQLAQPGDEQAARHARRTPRQLRERLRAAEQVAQQDGRPSFGKNLRGSSDRTVLPVGVHNQMSTHLRAPGEYGFWTVRVHLASPDPRECAHPAMGSTLAEDCVGQGCVGQSVLPPSTRCTRSTRTDATRSGWPSQGAWPPFSTFSSEPPHGVADQDCGRQFQGMHSYRDRGRRHAIARRPILRAALSTLPVTRSLLARASQRW